MTILEWSKREVEIAINADIDNPNVDIEYNKKLYERVLRAFECLIGDDNYKSILIGQEILNKLISSQPLSAIYDTPNVWDLIIIRDDATRIYHCNRMSGLVKFVYPNRVVRYSDKERYVFKNIHDGSVTKSFRLLEIMDEIYPISMPYYREKQLNVYIDSFSTNREYTDYDIVSLIYLEDNMNNRIEINRHFKKVDDNLIEIDFEEYHERNNTQI